jgi:phosphate acetyltransferase
VSVLDRVRARAAASPRRIAFPESADPRTRAAVAMLAAAGTVRPVLILDPSAPETHGPARAIGVETVDPRTDERVAPIAGWLAASPRARGLDAATIAALAATPLYVAAGLLRAGVVHGSVAGAVHTTAEVVRAALRLVGLAPGVTTLTSAFYMVCPAPDGVETVLTFADCAIIPEPTVDQLVEIAEAAADDRVRIVGDVPRVALLSYATGASAAGPSVDRMREAARRLRARRPDIAVDGPLQVDAALVAAVRARKAPASPLGGAANVLIFPSLDAGNIGYKLVQRLAGATAVGPILMGLSRPCADLSRGVAPDEIIHVAAITALQGRVEPSGEPT